MLDLQLQCVGCQSCTLYISFGMDFEQCSSTRISVSFRQQVAEDKDYYSCCAHRHAVVGSFVLSSVAALAHHTFVIVIVMPTSSITIRNMFLFPAVAITIVLYRHYCHHRWLRRQIVAVHY